MKRNILVTGAHRSGTTWTGKIISMASNVRYVQEPFNVAIKKYHSPFSSNYEYIHDDSPVEFQLKVKKYLKSFVTRNPLVSLQQLSHATTLKGNYYVLGDVINRWTHRTIFKDPLALFSAPWVAREMNCDVIVLARHPAAFIASLKVKNWEYNFKDLQRQTQLVTTYLQPFAEQIDEYTTHKKDIVSQGILIYNILYHTIARYQNEKYDNWMFVRHEDISRNPLDTFARIYEFLSLDFSEKVTHKIIETTTAKSATKGKRNAQQNIYTWKDRLTETEIATIKKETKAVWSNFYDEKDWL